MMMQELMLSIVLILVAAAAGIGIGILIARQSQVATPIPVKQEGDPTPADEPAEGNYEKARLVQRWLLIFNHFQRSLEDATTIEDMSRGFARAICQEFTDTGILVALGPLKAIVLLQAMPGSKHHIDLHTGSYIMTRPKIDDMLAFELAEMLFNAAPSHQAENKRWWLLREINPSLQDLLQNRFQMPGQGMLVPLRAHGVLYGLILISNSHIAKNANAARDNGEFATNLADMVATWVRCMAPHIVAGGTSPTTSLPVDMLASLDAVERASASLQSTGETAQIIEEVASYSNASLQSTPALSFAAEQSCAALMRICQADLSMVLAPVLRNGRRGFVIEAIRLDDWAWSRLQAPQGIAPEHPAITSGHLQSPWLDQFVRLADEQGKSVHATTTDDVRKYARDISELQMHSLLTLPARLDGQCEAIFAVGRRQIGGFSPQIELIASAIAAITTISLRTMVVTNERDKAYRAIDDTWKLASTITVQVLNALTSIVTEHGTLTATYPQQVATLAEQIARQLRLTPLEVYHIRMAALMSDIGTVAIPAAILLKEGRLSGEERQQMEEHPRVSAKIMSELSIFKNVLPLILHHHERWDGSGYPDHLVGSTIPIGARIIAVADVYTALQSPRPYRGTLTPEQALNQMKADAGHQFDPNVVHALTEILAQEAMHADDEAA